MPMRFALRFGESGGLVRASTIQTGVRETSVEKRENTRNSAGASEGSPLQGQNIIPYGPYGSTYRRRHTVVC